ncbi:MAG: tetratricopeptide repeat protein [Cyclobacteriaceae bacterium]
MAKVVKFAPTSPTKFGYKKAVVKRGRKKINLEDFGQLNIFNQPSEAKVVSLKPNLPPFEMGLAFEDKGDIESALESYSKAIKDKDHVADAFCNIGIIHSEKGESSKAIDAFTQCLKNDPRHYEAHYNLANLFSEIGNLQLAKVHYEMSTTINPDFSNGYYNLGLVLAMNREIDEAIETFLKYKETAPMNEKANALDIIRSLSETLAK